VKTLKFFLQHSWKIVLLSVITGIFSGTCNAALLAVISTALKGDGSPTVLIWGFVGLCVLLPIARFVSECFLTRLGQGAMYSLRMQLCRQVLAAPLRHLECLGAPRILSALTDDIPSLTNIVSIIPLLCVNAALVISCLVYMGILSWWLLVIVVAFMVLGIITYQLPIFKVQKIFSLARKETNALHEHFRALTQGTKELKIHRGRRNAFIKDDLEATAMSLQRLNSDALSLYTAAASWGQVLVFIVVGLIVFVFPPILNLKLPMVIAYTLALLYLMTPLQVIMNALPQMSRANVALQTVNELGFTLASQGNEDLIENTSPIGSWQRLEFEGVTHTYHRDSDATDFVLGPINLTFERGELVFIIGGNGSGKTTLVKLLTGLYAPEEGRIFLDNQFIGEERREFYRQHFSVVFSDFYLFKQMLGLTGPQSDKHAREYLEQLKLSHKVQINDGRLSTTELSQGQRKRLALLTAFLEDRPIYIFDEWAADQDPYFKEIFYLRLLPELKARCKTIFVISHDDRYYHVADRLIKLDEGKIVSDITKDLAIVGNTRA
jgi:putative ATP-binding cassette transporter